MHTLRVRRTGTVLLCLVLASVLMVEKPARAQAGWEWGIPIVNMPASWWQYMGATASGATIWASPLGVATGGGSATVTGAGTAGVVAQGGTALAAGQAVVAGGIGIGLGWGAYEAGLWKWLGCDHVLNTGSSACVDENGEPLDPLPGTRSIGPAATTMVVFSGSVTGTWDIVNDYEQWCWVDLGACIQSLYAGYPGGVDDDQADAILRVHHDGLPDPGTSSSARWWLVQKCSNGEESSMGSIQGNSSAVPAGTVLLDSEQSTRGCRYYGSGVGTESIGAYNQNGTHGEPAFVAYPEGAPAPGGANGGEYDEDRRIEVRVECTDYGDPAEPTVTDTITTDAFAPGQEVDIPGGSCPAGWTLTDYQAVRTVDGDPSADEVLFSHPGPSGLSSADPEAECYDGSCEVMIHRVVDGTPQPCSSEHVNCLGWMDAYLIDSTEWQCLWGGVHALPISDCEIYEHIDEATYTGPDVTDPATSEPDTGTNTGTSTNPTYVEDGCGGGSWLNPFDNVAGAIGCALEWAFIPSAEDMASIQADIEASTASVQSKAGFSQINQMEEWAAGIPGAVGDDAPGCWEAVMDTSMIPGDQNSLTVIDTCPPDPVVTWLHANRSMLEGFLYGAMIVPILWWAWRQAMPIIGGKP